VAQATRLLVLGVVRIFQPVHGYDVRRELVTWHVEDWASIAPGSVYNALKTLTKEGMLEVVGTDHVGKRPERTTYRLTPFGEQELADLLRDQLWTVRHPVDPLIAAISLMGFIARDELISALEARAAQVKGMVQHFEYSIAAVDNITTPDHVREMMRLISARLAAELPWSKALIARLKAGEYNTLGDPHWQPGPPLAKLPAKKSAAKKKPKNKR